MAAALLAASTPGVAATEPPPAHYVERLRMQAQLQGLNAELLSRDSATAVLQALCDRRDPAAPPIRARRVPAPDGPEDVDAARAALSAASNEAVRHRRVELLCGQTVLSHADNWYLPDRLTREMNVRLETTETPFGVVVRPLGFQRRTISARLLFEPLPQGWETQPAAKFNAPVTRPADVLQHRAVLQTRDGRPFSLLVETYTAAVLSP